MKRRELEDMKWVADSGLPLNAYKDSVFLITGATGLIGSLLIKNLLYLNQARSLNLKVLAVVRNQEKAEAVFADFPGDSHLEFVVCDLENDCPCPDTKIDYIIHTAAVTQSKMMVTRPVETIRLSVGSTDRLLSLAAEKQVKCFLYVSSMEVYGVMDQEGKTSEDTLGYLDLGAVRSCYPESKRLCECLCASYAEEYGVNTRIARLAQTFGAGILPGENRVFAQFARSALKKENIVLHTYGKSEGNYVYTRDAVRALLLLLVKGERAGAYNISNEKSHTTIREMAELVAHEIAGNAIRVEFDIPEDISAYGYAADTKLFLDSGKMQKLGWQAEVGLKEAFERMMDDMAQDSLANTGQVML